MQTVAIFGVGLIGGSFALALKKSGFQGTIAGVSSPATLEAARAAGAIDIALPADEAAATADLVYLAQPIDEILNTLTKLNNWVRPETLVTDAGSTKGMIVARAAVALSKCQFLGGHPLAGKERRGVQNADADLFRGRTYVLTPREEKELAAPAAAEFLRWLNRIGAVAFVTTPERHDDVVAYTSHLPQLTSTALAACLGDKFDGAAPPVFGPALIDSTRLALSSYEIWGDIVQTNYKAIDDALESFVAKLQWLRQDLRRDMVREAFEHAAEFAQRLRDST